METPVLTAARWRIGEFIFIGYSEAEAVIIDVGPFPSDPTNEQLDQAYDFLEKTALDFLRLGSLDWSLDLDQLTASFPALKPFALHGVLTHPAAFEVVSPPAPTRYFSKRLQEQGIYFLRIAFDFTPDKNTPIPSSDSPEDPGFSQGPVAEIF